MGFSIKKTRFKLLVHLMVRVNSKRVSIGNNPIQWGRCILAIYPYNTDMYTTEYKPACSTLLYVIRIKTVLIFTRSLQV